MQEWVIMNINDIKKIVTFNASSIPVLFEMCRIAKIAETINNMVDWRADNSKVSPGFLIETLIVTILRGRRPLWKIEEYWTQQKYNLLFEDSGITVEQLNDDTYARALDKLQTVNMTELVSRICLTMLQAHDISIKSLHLDTTSISVEGVYEDTDEGDFKIVHGHSKDYRPDLKQFKIGAAVQQDGLPMMGQLLSGNTSDKEWNPQAVLEMKAFFEKHQYKDIIFIGDSATVSSFEALEQLKGTLFISRFPENFGCVGAWKETAWQGVPWQEIGALGESKRKETAHYRLWGFRESVNGTLYRFILVHSSALRSQKEKTLAKRWEKERIALEKEAARLSKNGFACAEDALKASAAFMQKAEAKNYSIEVHLEEKVDRKYAKRGKPGKDAACQEKISYHVAHTISERDPMMCEYDLFKESTFVLITSLLDEVKYTNADILKEYKEQNSIEQAFRFLKSPVYLGPVFLKKAERIEALGYVFVLVLLIATYLEYRVRKSLNDRGEYLPQPGGHKAYRPSLKTILEVIDTVFVMSIDGELYLPDDTAPIILKMLDWAGFHASIYTKKINVIF
jgi:transposase